MLRAEERYPKNVKARKSGEDTRQGKESLKPFSKFHNKQSAGVR